ncbi:hypothetical protein GYMLUDRAFT_816166 [Collybiopsis luxurians FD-317 M1]|uniref:Uncharacterized protein n=1 Tax=Collybiopsis luxurians FD-317 M1 TaxID=944289 RepID=A0A0D0BMZ1_9AGAR|nr:hypothetical protein GYMLUDRAFT_816166 [Collybiopsis luxurians FD-317 M1]
MDLILVLWPEHPLPRKTVEASLLESPSYPALIPWLSISMAVVHAFWVPWLSKRAEKCCTVI